MVELINYYYTLPHAAKKLGFDIDDLLHYGETGQIILSIKYYGAIELIHNDSYEKQCSEVLDSHGILLGLPTLNISKLISDGKCNTTNFHNWEYLVKPKRLPYDERVKELQSYNTEYHNKLARCIASDEEIKKLDDTLNDYIGIVIDEGITVSIDDVFISKSEMDRVLSGKEIGENSKERILTVKSTKRSQPREIRSDTWYYKFICFLAMEYGFIKNKNQTIFAGLDREKENWESLGFKFDTELVRACLKEVVEHYPDKPKPEECGKKSS